MRPSREELFQEIWLGVKSLRGIARERGVSPNTVRRWCIADDVPYPSSEEMVRLKRIKRKMSTKYARKSIREKAERELDEELDRLWASHGCGEFQGKRQEGAGCCGCQD